MPIKDVDYRIRGAAAYSEMTAGEMAEALDETNVILLPVGSTEQAGPHLPTMADQIFSVEMCRRTVAALRERGKTVVLGPVVPFGDAGPWDHYPAGTVSIRSTTLITLLIDLCGSLISQGFSNIVLVQAHGGNRAAMEAAARELTQGTEAQVVCLYPQASYQPAFEKILKSTSKEGPYGESVTARILATHPELVRMDLAAAKKAVRPVPTRPGVVWPVKDYREYLPDGFEGDPTVATAETGNRLYGVIVEWMVETLESLFGDAMTKSSLRTARET